MSLVGRWTRTLVFTVCRAGFTLQVQVTSDPLDHEER